jgi:hypothetical protein
LNVEAEMAKRKVEMVERGAQQRAAIAARWSKPGAKKAASARMKRALALLREVEAKEKMK